MNSKADGICRCIEREVCLCMFSMRSRQGTAAFPCNSAITPVAPNINSWGITSDMYNDRKICQLNNLPKSAVDSCPRFECKLILK